MSGNASIKIGESTHLKTIPGGGELVGAPSYKTASTDIVSLSPDADGMGVTVTGLAKGQAVIEDDAMGETALSDTFTVTVTAPLATSIQLVQG